MRICMRFGSAAFLLAAAIVLAPPAVAAVKKMKGPSKSDMCGECHRDIYRMWRSSAHAQSMEDPVFLDVYRSTGRREGTEVTRICLQCHAPVAEMTKDFDLEQKTTWEGVGCDVCHGMTKVDVSDKGLHAVYDVGRVKRGPIRDAVSMAHEVEYSELHSTGEVCAPCHEYRNSEGVPIMTTYSEWKDSAASRNNRMCQDCHMSRTKADVVDPRVARTPEAQVNLHEVPGGHSLTQLNQALAVTLRPSRSGGQLQVEVGLKNAGAGHSVPTGMPGRRVIMDLGVTTSDGQSHQEQRVYGETFADSSGATIKEDCGYFARGVKRIEDNRIRPDEQRVETFRYPVPPQATAYVSLKLHYEHSPSGTKENRTYMTFYTTERVVGPETSAGR